MKENYIPENEENNKEVKTPKKFSDFKYKNVYDMLVKEGLENAWNPELEEVDKIIR